MSGMAICLIGHMLNYKKIACDIRKNFKDSDVFIATYSNGKSLDVRSVISQFNPRAVIIDNFGGTDGYFYFIKKIGKLLGKYDIIMVLNPSFCLPKIGVLSDDAIYMAGNDVRALIYGKADLMKVLFDSDSDAMFYESIKKLGIKILQSGGLQLTLV